MTWTSFFSSQLFGVIIGAVLTGGFTCFLDYLRSNREEKTHLKRKREELYEKLYDLLMRIEKDVRIRKNTFMSKETKDLYNELEQHTIWASSEISDYFYNLSQEIFDSADNYKKDKENTHFENRDKLLEFKQLLRKELGIKD